MDGIKRRLTCKARFLRDPNKTVELLNVLLDYCETYFGY